MDEQVWVDKYKPVQNPFTTGRSYENTLFETFGQEYEYVKTQNPYTIWTLMEGDQGDWFIASGHHWVNRLGYFICSVPLSEDESYEVEA